MGTIWWKNQKNSCNYLFFFVFILFSLEIFSEGTINKIRLQLNNSHGFQFAGYYTAKEKKYYENKNLDVEIKELKAYETPIVKVLKGDADIGIAGTELIIERAKGEKIVLLASIFQHSPMVFVSLKKSGIDSIHQVENRVIALGSNNPELLIYLNREGIDTNKLKTIPYTVGINNLLYGEIDMMSMNILENIYNLSKEETKFNIFNPRASGIDFYGDSIFTTEEFLRKNPVLVNEFLESTIEGWKYALKNREEAVKIIQKKYDDKLTKERLLCEAEEVDKLIVPEVVKIGYINRGRWEAIIEDYKSIGLIPKDFKLDSFFLKTNIEIDLKWLRYFGMFFGIFIIFLTVVFRIIYVYNKKLNKEIKEKNKLLDVVIKSETELKEFMMSMENIPISVIMTDTEKIIKYANENTYKSSGYSKEEIVGRDFKTFVSRCHPNDIYLEILEKILKDEEWKGECKSRTKTGEEYWEKVVVMPVKRENNEFYSILILKEEITESKKHRDLLQDYAEKDELTGINNRRFGMRVLESRVEIAKKEKSDLYICFMDLNKLKYVNDFFGHEYGDEMLKAFSKIVSKQLREKDTFFRLGGDEFVIIFSNSSLEICEKIWERIRNEIENDNQTKDRFYNISASHGIVKFSDKFENVEEFVAEADKKMYDEKKIYKKAENQWFT